MPADDLETERRHLTESRAELARMRAKAESLDSRAAGDWVSQIVLERARYQRMRALEDDPTVPLFFGRLDYEEDSEHPGTFHVGRRHVTDAGGDPLVVDWRAPVSLPFYRASPHERYGVARRRRFGFRAGELTAYEDEDLLAGSDPTHSSILEDEIERPREGPMRDIVATIQPEQDVIVRAGLATSVCVQGAPGTGKTAVGLHRAAFLLYAHRDQLTRQGVLVVGPHDGFLRYIGDVLPALGEIDADQTTVEALAGAAAAALDSRVTVSAAESAAVATLKGDARMADVLARALWSQVTEPTEQLVVPRGSSRWRVPAHEVAEIVAELRGRGVRYAAGRSLLAQRLAHAVLVRMELAGESPDDRVQDAVARSRPVKQYVDTVWPAVHPLRLLHRLYTDEPFRRDVTQGTLDDAEASLLARPGRSARSAPWTVADAVLLDELADLLERTPSLGHVVVDEAQDLSPMMLRAVGRRASTGSVTVLGDLAQATTPWGSRSWEDALAHLGKPAAEVVELVQGFRVPGAVIDYAARLLPLIAPDLTPPVSVRRSRGELHVEHTTDLTGAVAAALDRAGPGSVGVVVPDALVPTLGVPEDSRVELVPASLSKGLEFDHVVLVEPAAVVEGEPDRVTGLRRLYVCLTRAVTSLVVLHTEPLPPELGRA